MYTIGKVHHIHMETLAVCNATGCTFPGSLYIFGYNPTKMKAKIKSNVLLPFNSVCSTCFIRSVTCGRIYFYFFLPGGVHLIL